MSQNKPRAAMKIVLAVASFAFSILLIEFVLRLVGVHYSPVDIEVVGGAHDARFQFSFENSDFEFDPEQIWRPRPGRSVFNDLGYRGRVVAPSRAPGEIRVLALGDSNTLGWGSKDLHWPRFLEQDLEAAHPPANVINAGVWGHTAAQGDARMRQFMVLDPNVVLISYGANEAHKVAVSDAEYVSRVSTTPERMFLYRFAIGRLILKVEDAIAGRERATSHPELVFRVSPAEYEAHLIEMIQSARSRGARVFLLTRPWIGDSPTPDHWKNFGPEYMASTFAVGERLGVPVIDVNAAFAGQDEYFEDESHFNEAGHRRAGRLIADAILTDLGATPLP